MFKEKLAAFRKSRLYEELMATQPDPMYLGVSMWIVVVAISALVSVILKSKAGAVLIFFDMLVKLLLFYYLFIPKLHEGKLRFWPVAKSFLDFFVVILIQILISVVTILLLRINFFFVYMIVSLACFVYYAKCLKDYEKYEIPEREDRIEASYFPKDYMATQSIEPVTTEEVSEAPAESIFLRNSGSDLVEKPKRSKLSSASTSKRVSSEPVRPISLSKPKKAGSSATNVGAGKKASTSKKTGASSSVKKVNSSTTGSKTVKSVSKPTTKSSRTESTVKTVKRSTETSGKKSNPEAPKKVAQKSSRRAEVKGGTVDKMVIKSTVKSSTKKVC